MKILVFGLGALGTVYSCLLKEKGHEVLGIDHETVAAVIGNKGVKINGIWGEHEVHLDKVASSLKDLDTRDLDLIILTVKSYETANAVKQLQGLVSSNTYLLLAQNGYGNFEAAAASIPEEKIIVARVIFGAETVDAGFSRVTVIADDVILGSPANLIASRVLEKFARVFSDAGIPTRTSEEIMKYIWGKIIYNSALNPLGAILEVNYGKLAETEHSRKIMDDIVAEIFAVLSAAKQETMWPDAQSYLKDFYAQMIPSTASHHSSMLQDIQRGRKTEIDVLNGAVVELGKKYGVGTPANALIYSLLKTKEELLLR